MVNKTIEELVVETSITDPSGTTHTELNSGGGAAGTAWDHSGTVAAQQDVILFLMELADTKTLSVESYTATRADATPLPTNSSLSITTVDGSGNSSVKTVIKDFDGSTLTVDTTSDASYENTTGGSQLVAVQFINDTTGDIDVFTSGTVAIN